MEVVSGHPAGHWRLEGSGPTTRTELIRRRAPPRRGTWFQGTPCAGTAGATSKETQ